MKLEKEKEIYWRIQFKKCFQCSELKSRKSFKKGHWICLSCENRSFPSPKNGIGKETNRKWGIFWILSSIFPTAFLNPESNGLLPEIKTRSGEGIFIYTSACESEWDFKINLDRLRKFRSDRDHYIILVCLSTKKTLRRVFLIPIDHFFPIPIEPKLKPIIPHRIKINRKRMDKFNIYDIRIPRNREIIFRMNDFSAVPLLEGVRGRINEKSEQALFF